MADLATFVDAAPGAGRTGRDVLDRAIRRTRSPAPIGDRGHGDDPAPLRQRCTRRRWPSRRSAPGRKNSLQWEIDGSESAAGLGLRDAGPALARPSRPAERDPPPEPGADGRGRPRGRRAPGRPRGGLRRHVRGAVPGDLRGRRRRPTAAADPPYADFADGHDEMLVNDAIAARARASGRWVDVERATPSAPHRRRTEVLA